MEPEPAIARPWALTALVALAAAAVAVGVVARFRGLGAWPLTTDEYYLAESVQNILRTGWPRYPCGGLYVRGLGLQYAAAVLQWLGASAELAPRAIAAVANVLGLPAVYLLGRRIGGRTVGLIGVTILAVSVWEVEVARFGRMYAPFQAVVAWYLVAFLAYTVDRRRAALLAMIGLSIAGVLIWEGGLFLAMANLLPPFLRRPGGRLHSRDWGFLAGMGLLCLPGYLLATLNLRSAESEPALPPDYRPPPELSLSKLDAARLPWTTLHLHPGWALVALFPVALGLRGLVRLRTLRPSPSAWAGLAAVLGAALFHQFALAAALVLLLHLLAILDCRMLLAREARAFCGALAACLAFWLTYGVATTSWHAPGVSGVHTLALLAYEFVRVPDVVREVVLPWAHTIPVLGAGLLVLTAAATLRALAYPASVDAERLLLALLILFLLAASASHPPRHETRYVFFLYPVALIIALTTLRRWVDRSLAATRLGTWATAATAALALAGFAATEDFQPWHLTNIDTAVVAYRIGMSPEKAQHYQPRSDLRGAAAWLGAHVRGDDLVVSSFPGIDFYYPRSNFYFMDTADPRFESWSCRRGRYERWSTLPLLHSSDALLQQVGSGRRVWIVAETNRLAVTMRGLPRTEWSVEWMSNTHDIAIVSAHATAGLPGNGA